MAYCVAFKCIEIRVTVRVFRDSLGATTRRDDDLSGTKWGDWRSASAYDYFGSAAPETRPNAVQSDDESCILGRVRARTNVGLKSNANIQNTKESIMRLEIF